MSESTGLGPECGQAEGEEGRQEEFGLQRRGWEGMAGSETAAGNRRALARDSRLEEQRPAEGRIASKAKTDPFSSENADCRLRDTKLHIVTAIKPKP